MAHLPHGSTAADSAHDLGSGIVSVRAWKSAANTWQEGAPNRASTIPSSPIAKDLGSRAPDRTLNPLPA
jgi:hypothetical protein